MAVASPEGTHGMGGILTLCLFSITPQKNPPDSFIGLFQKYQGICLNLPARSVLFASVLLVSFQNHFHSLVNQVGQGIEKKIAGITLHPSFLFPVIVVGGKRICQLIRIARRSDVKEAGLEDIRVVPCCKKKIPITASPGNPFFCHRFLPGEIPHGQMICWWQLNDTEHRRTSGKIGPLPHRLKNQKGRDGWYSQ